ncbi:MAG: hypothetical protein JRG92_15735 [Deltaproteobacteria bacterium]|nr:hypothetical protein [Deltaproteobacteria bacterium]MBW2385083.1 hypothetical protein [Deltaproteobacteria bacterium]MBW2696721.1 hypothetical protein [Deltaproteobacteria bacterium]
MEASYLSGADVGSLLDPGGAAWRGARSERIALMGTPVGLQPTEAIRAKWIDKKIGAIGAVSVAALHDGTRLAFRLEWEDTSESREISDTTAFPDAAAVALPSAEGSPIMTMGAVGAAVNAWYWRADEEGQGRQVVAEGLGTSRGVEGKLVHAQGLWKEGRWSVVISRDLEIATDEPVAQLTPGQRTGFGVTVWEGSGGERAGIKAFSGDWIELVLQPLPTARG